MTRSGDLGPQWGDDHDTTVRVALSCGTLTENCYLHLGYKRRSSLGADPA